MKRFSMFLGLGLMASIAAQADWMVSRPDDFTRNDGSEADLRAVSFADDNHGWAVGDKATILRTADGGVTWVKQTLPPPQPQGQQGGFGGFGGGGATPQLWRVTAVDAQTAWVLGVGGVLAKTTDGGETWTRMTPPNRNRLIDISFLTPEIGFIVGENATLLGTKDGGATWESLVSGRRARAGDNRVVFDGILFATPQRGWVVGATGTILATEDGGATWNSVELGQDVPENLYGGAFISETNGFIVGQEGVVLATADGGKTWSRVDNPAQEDYVDIYDIAFVKSQPPKGWIVGDAGTLLETDDGGKSWQKAKVKIKDALMGVSVTPSGRAFAVGGWGCIWMSAPPTTAKQ